MWKCKQFNSVLAVIASLIAIAALARNSCAQNSPQDYLNGHKTARAKVNVGPLTWSETLASYAQSYANQRAGDCVLMHSNGPYGENLAGISRGDLTGTQAVKLWVKEKPYYNYDYNQCVGGMQCGHYTQVVWNSTGYVGCARAPCNNGGTFVICSYYPPGNIRGRRPY